MAIIPGQTGTTTKAVDGLEGPTAGSPVSFPSGFSGNFVPTALADANATLTSANSIVVMTPTANRVLTLPSSVPSAAFAITIINRSASFTIAVNASGGGTVVTVGLGQVTVLSTQTNPTTTAHWTISTNNAALQGGNSFGATMLLGTNDNFGLDFETNGTVKVSIGTDGILTASNGAPGSAVRARFNASNPPASLSYFCANGNPYLGFNTNQTASTDGQTYTTTNPASRVVGPTGSGALSLDVAASGTAGNAITWVNALTASAAGAVTVGPSGTSVSTLVHTFNLPTVSSYGGSIAATAVNSMRLSAGVNENIIVSARTTQNNAAAFAFIGGTSDTNTLADMYWQVLENDNTNHATLTNDAYRWYNGAGTVTMSATRAGVWTLGPLSTGSASVPTATATTLFGLDQTIYRGRTLLVTAHDNGATHIGGYAMILVLWNGGAYTYQISQPITGTNGGTFSVSGNNLQITHSFGSTRTVSYRVVIV